MVRLLEFAYLQHFARITPWKFNIDTKNYGWEEVSPFNNCYFWYPS